MQTDRRKLIFVWNYVEWGGAQIYFLGIMKLAKADWDITVLLPRDSDRKLLKFLDTAEIRYEFLDNRFDMEPASSLTRKVVRRWRILRSEAEVLSRLRKHDLRTAALHIEAAPWQSSLLLLLLLLGGANVFVTMHNALPPASWARELLWRSRIRLVSRFSNFHLFASNQDTKERFRRWVDEGVWQRIKVTYTTVNPEEIEAVRQSAPTRSQLRADLEIDDNVLMILCVGQFIDRKGRWIFLEAAREAARRIDAIEFVWVTSTPLAADDWTRINEYGLGRRLRLIPADQLGDERSDILSFYKSADVYALPSYVEGLPVALLEGMAMGLAAVSTNIYAIPEAIIHEQTGLLIEPGDVPALTSAIVRLAIDPALRGRLAEAGRNHVLASFDERVASRIAIDTYTEALVNNRTLS